MNRVHPLEVHICIVIALVGACIEYWLNKIGMSAFTYPVMLGD